MSDAYAIDAVRIALDSAAASACVPYSLHLSPQLWTRAVDYWNDNGPAVNPMMGKIPPSYEGPMQIYGVPAQQSHSLMGHTLIVICFPKP